MRTKIKRGEERERKKKKGEKKEKERERKKEKKKKREKKREREERMTANLSKSQIYDNERRLCHRYLSEARKGDYKYCCLADFIVIAPNILNGKEIENLEKAGNNLFNLYGGNKQSNGLYNILESKLPEIYNYAVPQTTNGPTGVPYSPGSQDLDQEIWDRLCILLQTGQLGEVGEEGPGEEEREPMVGTFEEVSANGCGREGKGTAIEPYKKWKNTKNALRSLKALMHSQGIKRELGEEVKLTNGEYEKLKLFHSPFDHCLMNRSKQDGWPGINLHRDNEQYLQKGTAVLNTSTGGKSIQLQQSGPIPMNSKRGWLVRRGEGEEERKTFFAYINPGSCYILLPYAQEVTRHGVAYSEARGGDGLKTGGWDITKSQRTGNLQRQDLLGDLKEGSTRNWMEGRGFQRVENEQRAEGENEESEWSERSVRSPTASTTSRRARPLRERSVRRYANPERRGTEE